MLWACSLDWWKIKRPEKSFVINVLRSFLKTSKEFSGKITNTKVNRLNVVKFNYLSLKKVDSGAAGALAVAKFRL